MHNMKDRTGRGCSSASPKCFGKTEDANNRVKDAGGYVGSKPGNITGIGMDGSMPGNFRESTTVSQFHPEGPEYGQTAEYLASRGVR